MDDENKVQESATTPEAPKEEVKEEAAPETEGNEVLEDGDGEESEKGE